MDQSGTMQNRRARRAPVLLTASLDVYGVPTSVKLRNLSAEGALVEGASLPEPGATTYFTRNELHVRCKVV